MSRLTELLDVSPVDLRARVLRPVTVVVIDSGIDATHSDLEGRVVRSFKGTDGDASEPFRAIERPNDANNDSYGHGTGVASRIAGIAPNARFIDLAALGSDNTATGRLVVGAIRWAVLESGASLVNISIAVSNRFAPELREIAELAVDEGVTLVASMRNLPRMSDLGYPAAMCGAIGVETTNVPEGVVRFRPRSKIEFETKGTCTVAAPGGGYTDVIGTSFAAPAITGLCALLAGAEPDLTIHDYRAWLRRHADRASVAGGIPLVGFSQTIRE